MRSLTPLIGFLCVSIAPHVHSQFYAAQPENQWYYYQEQQQPQYPQQQQQPLYWPAQQIYAAPQPEYTYPAAPQPPHHLYVPRQQPTAPPPPPPPQPPPPPSTPQQPIYVAEKKNIAQTRIVSANTFEFDLPPPPPSRFLPDEERAKIVSTNKQGRPEHVGTTSVHQRIRVITNERPLVSQSRNPQFHRIQVPRIASKVNSTVEFPIVQSTTIRPQRPTPTIAVTEPRVVITRPPTTRAPPPSPTTTTPQPTTTTQTERNSEKKVNPNKAFLQCCKNKNVAKSCESRCNFDNINKKVITAMFLGSDPCPQSYGLDLFACAAQESDHTTCCRSKNVQRTSAGEKCLGFCNLTPSAHFQADASYLPCWAVLNDVKTCFKQAIINGGPMQ